MPHKGQFVTTFYFDGQKNIFQKSDYDKNRPFVFRYNVSRCPGFDPRVPGTINCHKRLGNNAFTSVSKPAEKEIAAQLGSPMGP